MTLPLTSIQSLLAPYLPDSITAATELPLDPALPPILAPFELPKVVLQQVSDFLDLLVRWNASTNLTAIRDPEQMVRRHFGESLFLACHLARHLPNEAKILDFGSGAGFPGIPLQLLYPSYQLTLAESQGKKASFLREASRVLGLRCEVWANRAENLPISCLYDAVTMRAVDNRHIAAIEARQRVAPGGVLASLTTEPTVARQVPGFARIECTSIPASVNQVLELWRKDVPRGTSVSSPANLKAAL